LSSKRLISTKLWKVQVAFVSEQFIEIIAVIK